MARIVLIGSNHAGTAAANTILDAYPGNQLTIIERNTNISYLGCGTALWVGGQIDGPEGLFYCSADKLEAKGAKVLMSTEVTSIDRANKRVTARTADGREIVEPYDTLILATGSLPVAPPIPGSDKKGIQFCKLFQEGAALDEALKGDAVKTVAVVGAGYIGVELAEAAHRRGKKTLLFDVMPTSLGTYYDPDFCAMMDAELEKNDIECHFGEGVKEFKGDSHVRQLVTDKGAYDVDLVVMCIGFKPNSALFAGKLDQAKNGACVVDRHQRTSDPSIFAVGDCATIYSNALRSFSYIALASNAVRSGIVAAHNACGTPLEAQGVQGSNGICVFGLKFVSTGLSLTAAQKAGFDATTTEFEDLQRPAFMKGDNPKVKLRIVYDRASRRVLGAQMASRYDMSMGIHMFSLAIEEGVTIEKLQLLDIFFLPHFNQPYNYITMAALSAK